MENVISAIFMNVSFAFICNIRICLGGVVVRFSDTDQNFKRDF